MPLHDWNATEGWSGLHTFWLVEIAKHLKAHLPAGYRAYIGSSPVVAIDDPAGEPDVGVRRSANGTPAAPPSAPAGESDDPFRPDREVVVATLVDDKSVYVERGGRLVAVVELVSPGNKDRADRKAKYLTRYIGYLTNGVHLLLVDLHPRPYDYSFADQLAARLQIPDEPPLPAPFAVSYRVGEAAATGGRYLAWRRAGLAVGARLPELPLALSDRQFVAVGLEATYAVAAENAYLA